MIINGKTLPSKDIAYNDLRVKEFLLFTKLNPEKAILGRDTLDAGCGIGRYTYVMQTLGANSVKVLILVQKL